MVTGVQTCALPIYLESIFETLPPGFVKDFAYGLGLLKDCNRLIRLIEANTLCTEIIFTDGNSAAIDGTEFHLGLSRFAAIWAEIGRINDRGNRAAGRVKDVFVHNNLAATFGLANADFSLGRHPDSRVIAKTANGIEELSSIERDALVEAVSSESAAIAAGSSQKFQQLKRDIELVSLDRLFTLSLMFIRLPNRTMLVGMHGSGKSQLSTVVTATTDRKSVV